MIFELIEFIDSDHQYVFLISPSTKSKLVEVTLNQSKPSTSTDTKSRTRTTSKTSEHSRPWPLNWAIDKPLFKKAIKRFESCFPKLISNREISENLSTDNIIIKQSRHISMSEQNSFSFNTENPNEFSSAQLIDLIRLISQALDSRQSNINTNVNVNLESHSSQSSSDVFDHRQFKNWSAEEIEFFDPVAKETDSIVNVEKHVLYKDVYAFTNRLKNMTVIKEDSKLRLIIFQCLRESTLIWHSIELSTLKKEMLKNASLINWYNALIRRFKKRTSIVLTSMQTIKYIMKNVKQQKDSRLFAQNLFRAVKAANLISTHNQLIIAWNNLTWQFRQHISESTEHTTMRGFLKQLNSQTSIWYEMTKPSQSAFRKYSKSYYRNERNANYFNRINRFSKSNNAYKNYQDREREKPRMKVTIKIEKKSISNEREFAKNNERKFAKNNRNKTYNNERHRYKSRDKYKTENKSQHLNSYKNKKKIKAFVFAKKNMSNNDSDVEDYHQSEDLAYFDSNHDDYDYDDNSKVSAHLIIASEFSCRQCKISFASNNLLHKHLRGNCNDLHISISNAYPADSISDAYSAEAFFDHETTTIVKSKIDANKNIETEYEFRKWQYATKDVNLTKDEKASSACWNTEAEITLTDTKFFTQNSKDIRIRTMTTSITVRELNIQKHSSDKYVIAFMYFPSVDDTGRSVRAMIIRKIHLIDNLKINLLIENDILSPKLIDISASTNSAYIESCGITVSIRLRSRFSSQVKFVHITRTIIISSQTEIAVPVHIISMPDRDYIFEPDQINFAIYAHIVNIDIKVILIRNNTYTPVKIPRNFRLDKITEMTYPDACLVDSVSKNLVLKHSKAHHKKAWFKKIITAFANATNAIEFDSTDIILSNDVTIHNSSVNAMNAFFKLVWKHSTLWISHEFAELSEENWMRIPLKSNWKFKIKDKAKIYSIEVKNKIVIDATFDKLHQKSKLKWTFEATSFSFSCFVVWRESVDQKKKKVVIDIRNLNSVTMPDAYFIFLQTDIIQAVSDCRYISVIDCSEFFYQWRVHLTDRHKLTVVTHKDQETFNVTVMNFRNSPSYVQRQIDRVLRSYKHCSRAYVDDIVIFSKFKEDHLTHLRDVFDILAKNNIAINSKKAFIDYSSVILLEQRVTSLRLSINQQKVKAIASLNFLKTLDQLKTYLDLTDWLRQYVPHYADKSESLHNRKTTMLKSALKADNARKSYSSKTRIDDSTIDEIVAYKYIQSCLSKSNWLIHFDSTRQLYIDLNSSKKRDINSMIYHVSSSNNEQYFARTAIQLIMFLNRLINPAKSRYWSTELKLVELIWILRKIRHLIESSKISTIVYIDHEASLDIVKQTSFTTSSIDKLNLRLVRAFDYIQRFNLIIKHKSERLHLISDALSRLSIKTFSQKPSYQFESEHDEKLDVLFIAAIVKINSDFKQKLIQRYVDDSAWIKIIEMLNSNDRDNTDFSFMRDNDFIYRRESSDNMSFVSQRLCVSKSFVKEILSMIHDSTHSGFDKIYHLVICSWYIQRLIKHVKNYIRHCFKCTINQIRRHKSYDSLQSILTSSVFFYVIAIDFVLTLPLFHTDMNSIMFITCKFSKRVIAIVDKSTWSAFEWAKTLLSRLNIADWGLFKVIVSNRNKKFLSDLWKSLFNRLNVRLLYIIAYHSQTDDASERTNQTLEIVLRFHIQMLQNVRDWLKILKAFQRHFNNTSESTDKFFNEACYSFTSLRNSNLLINQIAFTSSINTKLHIVDFIALSQALFKHIYDQKHRSIQLQVDQWALLRFHKNYDILSTVILSLKLSQQYADSFRISEKIGNLVYRLEISENWRIHSVFSIAHLEPAEASTNDSFHRTSVQSKPVFVEENNDLVKSFEIEKILINRRTVRRDIEYLVRWKEYDPKHDVWRNLSKLDNAKKLVDEFNQRNVLSTRRNRERSKRNWCISENADDLFFYRRFVIGIILTTHSTNMLPFWHLKCLPCTCLTSACLSGICLPSTCQFDEGSTRLDSINTMA